MDMTDDQKINDVQIIYSAAMAEALQAEGLPAYKFQVGSRIAWMFTVDDNFKKAFIKVEKEKNGRS